MKTVDEREMEIHILRRVYRVGKALASKPASARELDRAKSELHEACGRYYEFREDLKKQRGAT